jgi:hypothetical protein
MQGGFRTVAPGDLPVRAAALLLAPAAPAAAAAPTAAARAPPRELEFETVRNNSKQFERQPVRRAPLRELEFETIRNNSKRTCSAATSAARRAGEFDHAAAGPTSVSINPTPSASAHSPPATPTKMIYAYVGIYMTLVKVSWNL